VAGAVLPFDDRQVLAAALSQRALSQPEQAGDRAPGPQAAEPWAVTW
jgi:hypothetical protein